jgi:hypothetical protein
MQVSEIDRLLGSDSIPDLTSGLYNSTNTIGLEQLNECLNSILTGKADYEISTEAKFIREYIAKHPDCVSLFKVWIIQQEQRLVQIEGLVLGVFSRLLNLLGGMMKNAPGAAQAGNSIVKRIVYDHREAWIKLLTKNLNSDTIPLIQNTLRLLCAVASFNPPVFLKDIQGRFDFGLKSLARLLRYRKTATLSKDGDERTSVPVDVRTLYIRFICMFIRHGDSSVKKQCLETKDLVSGAVKGLDEDVYETATDFLTLLKESIVQDSLLSKSAKVSFFNGYVLEQV